MAGGGGQGGSVSGSIGTGLKALSRLSTLPAVRFFLWGFVGKSVRPANELVENAITKVLRK